MHLDQSKSNVLWDLPFIISSFYFSLRLIFLRAFLISFFFLTLTILFFTSLTQSMVIQLCLCYRIILYQVGFFLHVITSNQLSIYFFIKSYYL